MKISRRQLMLGGAAVGATGLGVGVYGLTGGAFDYYKAMLQYYLPGVTIPDEAVRAFADDAVQGRNSDFAPKLKALTAGTRIAGFSTLQAAIGDTFAFEKFNREFLTYFMLNSNFFEMPDPRSGTVEYYGVTGACGNPFAEFTPPPT